MNLRLRWVFSLMAGAALLWQAPGAAAATPGVSGERVLFGQSAAFSGPAQALGKNMLLGIQAAFEAANARGGVHGRKLDLVSFDDAYEPEAAIANTRNLIENEKVFALIGAVGTPTSLAAVPVAAEAEVPYIAPFTGASFLRDPKWKNVINMRASYFQETEEMVNRLIQDRGIRRIAVLYQDDSFGRAGWQGVLRALKRRKLEPTGTGVYPRNTRVVKTALLDIRRARPEAVIIIGAYAPVSFFINWARQIGFNPVFVNISFVGSNALARALGTSGHGVFVTQVVPFPTSDDYEITVDYLRDLAAYDSTATPGFVSLEGYIAGRLAILALELCGPQPDRACLLAGLRREGRIDMGDFFLHYGKDDNQGSDAVYLTVIGEDGKYVSTDRMRLSD